MHITTEILFCYIQQFLLLSEPLENYNVSTDFTVTTHQALSNRKIFDNLCQKSGYNWRLTYIEMSVATMADSPYYEIGDILNFYGVYFKKLQLFRSLLENKNSKSFNIMHYVAKSNNRDDS